MINKDWVIQPQWDNSKIRKGYEALNDKMNRLERKQAKTLSYEKQATKVSASKYQIERKQLQLRNAINRAVSMGMDTQRAGMHELVANSRNLNKLESRRLSVEKWITAEKKKQAVSMPGRKSERASLSRESFLARKGDVKRNLDSELSAIKRADVGGKLKSDGALRSQYGILLSRLREVRSELNKVQSGSALVRLRSQARDLTLEMRNLKRGVKEANGAFDAQRFAIGKLKASMMHMIASYSSFFTLIHGTTAFYRLGTQFDSMRASLLAASGDAGVAEENMEFLIETSQKLGVSLTAGVAGFNKLGVAARAQGYTMEETREAYLAIAEAGTAFQLNAAKQNLVFLAVSQMVSKAKVSAEELRRQLGDNMPIAIEAMRRAWSDFKGEDISMPDFTKAMETGKIMTKDVLPAFSKHMRDMARDGGALEAAMQKVSTRQMRALAELQLNVKDAFDDSTPLFGQGWDNLTESLKSSKPVFIAIGKILGTIFNVGSVVIRTLSPMLSTLGVLLNNLFYPFERLFEVIDKVGTEGTKNLTAFESVLSKLAGVMYLFVAAGFAVIDTFKWLNKWLTVKDDDNFLTKIVKWATSAALSLLFLSKIVKGIGKLFNVMTFGAFGKVLGAIRGLFSGAGISKIGGALSTLGRGAATLASRFNLITAAVSSVVTALVSLWNFISGKDASNWISDLIPEDIARKIGDTIGVTVDSVKSLAGNEEARKRLNTVAKGSGRDLKSFSDNAFAGKMTMMGAGATVNMTNHFNGVRKEDADRLVRDVEERITMAR